MIWLAKDDDGSEWAFNYPPEHHQLHTGEWFWARNHEMGTNEFLKKGTIKKILGAEIPTDEAILIDNKAYIQKLTKK